MSKEFSSTFPHVNPKHSKSSAYLTNMFTPSVKPDIVDAVIRECDSFDEALDRLLRIGDASFTDRIQRQSKMFRRMESRDLTFSLDEFSVETFQLKGTSLNATSEC
eukprot:TRINITY_DN20801_c0_g1_i1.p1 TRINITY_DN20801_c0_g1~~TRINITY_DN20801_c0_g1_i1.p1  ORF type:complete len:106 (-),score=11.02 TRINITY_DN20801_c0_g1_i1:173-490(-)